MARIEMTEQMMVGIEDVDAQHGQLIGIYNDLDAALMIGRGQKEMKDILDRLVVYTCEHFKFEEDLMRKADYPALETHRVEHRQLIDKVGRFQHRFDLGLERVARPVMDFLNFWLKNHIMQSDVEFGNYARSRPVGED